MYDVVLSPEAQTFYADADRPLARRLARCFEQLERDPVHHNNIRRLTGPFVGLSRYRVGDWRVLFRVDEPAMRVAVLLVARRREVYE